MAWRPEVMFILMLIAIYGIIGELNLPGAILPGIVGSIALVLAFYMAAILSVNVAGLLLIGFAIVLFVIDVYATTHGVLTGGGIVGISDRFTHAIRPSCSILSSFTELHHSGCTRHCCFLRICDRSGASSAAPAGESRHGDICGEISEHSNSHRFHGGMVFVEGEYWNATSEVPVEKGRIVEISAVEGLRVKVEPKI
jgi:membrane-bound serine protease (ClpP class)